MSSTYYGWYDRVVERDWFGASKREEARDWIARCAELLEDFEEKVFAAQESDETDTAFHAEPLPTPMPLGRTGRQRGPRAAKP